MKHLSDREAKGSRTEGVQTSSTRKLSVNFWRALLRTGTPACDAAARSPPDGQAARGRRVLVPGREPLLSPDESADGGEGLRHADPGTDAARPVAERDDADDRCEGVHRVARPAGVGGEEQESRHAG